MEKLYCLFNIKEKTFYKDYINCGSYKTEVVKTWKTLKGAQSCLNALEYRACYNKEDYQVMLLSTKKVKEI